MVSTGEVLEAGLKTIKALEMVGPVSKRKMTNSSLSLSDSCLERKQNRLGGDVGGEVGLGYVGVRAERGAHYHQPKS